MILAQQDGQGSGLSFLIFIVIIFGAMYFLMIRPQQQRRRQFMELVRALEVGDEVETIGGIYGTIRRLDADTVWLEIAAGTTVRLTRGAIRRKLTHEEGSDRTP